MHLGELEELSLRIASSGVKGVRADMLVCDIVTKVSALIPKPAWRLTTPFSSSNSFK